MMCVCAYICICMYVCMYVYIYIYIYMYKKSTLVKRVRWLIMEVLMLDVRSKVSTSTNLEPSG